MKIKVDLSGRDSIEVETEEPSTEAQAALKSVSFVGCSSFIKTIQNMRSQFGDDLSKWPVPTDRDHSSLLIKELILKLRGEWIFPYPHTELCHCRSVSTHTVDQAVIAGALTPEIVTRQTTAGTSCGTCRQYIESIIQFRLR